MIDLRHHVFAVLGDQCAALVWLRRHHETARYAGATFDVVLIGRAELDVVAALTATMTDVIQRHRSGHRTRFDELRSIVVLRGLRHDGLKLFFFGLVQAGQIGRFEDVTQRDVRLILRKREKSSDKQNGFG